MNAPSPGVISLFLPNTHYPSRSRYLEVLAEALLVEYRAILASGLQLQLDCPDLALSRHMQFADLSDAEFVALAADNMAVLRNVLQDLETDRVRLHICWGNYEGPHICDIGMDKVVDILLAAPARYILFENANPRHAHEWTVFRDRREQLGPDTVLVPGVIDSTTNFVEHPDVVTQRLERFLDFLPASQLMAGTDCGFGTFAGFGAVDPAIAYAKLASLAAGTRQTTP